MSFIDPGENSFSGFQGAVNPFGNGAADDPIRILTDIHPFNGKTLSYSILGKNLEWGLVPPTFLITVFPVQWRRVEKGYLAAVKGRMPPSSLGRGMPAFAGMTEMFS